MMRSGILLLAFVTIAGFVAAAEPVPIDHDLEDAELGRIPLGWIAYKTGNGDGSVWSVLEDKSARRGAKILTQIAASPKHLFNLCVIDDSNFLNGEISVAFKAIGGKNDQGGGIVWRFIDSNNYYLARMNPLESNLRLYKVVAGRRIQIASNDELKVPTDEWHTLSVFLQGDEIVCLMDGEKQLEASDATYRKPGKVGLWTKADAQTYFDDLVAMPKE